MERIDISSRKLELSKEYFIRMGTIKDRNGKDLTEAEEIKKRWEECTEELYKKVLMTQITMIVWSLTKSPMEYYSALKRNSCHMPLYG